MTSVKFVIEMSVITIKTLADRNRAGFVLVGNLAIVSRSL